MQGLINLIDFVREYEKTGLEGFSGFALVPDCCHIVATVYCSGMDNHCVIFTIFLDHDLCIFMAFCSRPHGSMNVRCRYPCVKLWEMGRTPSSGEPLQPRIGRHHSSLGFISPLCIEVRELWGIICWGTRSVPSQWSRHTRDSCHIRTTFITWSFPILTPIAQARHRDVLRKSVISVSL